MSVPILIIGESGAGKSTSIRNLDSKETFIIKVIDKPLPFKAQKKYVLINEKNPKGNVYITANYNHIINALTKISETRSEIKTIIIDDFQYLMAIEFMNRASEKNYDKFTEIAQHVWEILKYVPLIRNDLDVIFLAHSEVTDEGRTKCKTIGKLLDKQICLEGLFTIVLNAIANEGKYLFLTQNLGNNVAKSPLGMFEESYIENDLKFVLEKVHAYYEEEEEVL